MRRWSELAERVAATTRTSEKSSILADYLRTLRPEELPIAVVFLTGRAFAETDQRSTGLGWATMAAALSEVTGTNADDLGAAYDRFSDLGLAIEDVLTRAGHAPDLDLEPDLETVAAAFSEIERASGPAAKRAISADATSSLRLTTTSPRNTTNKPWPGWFCSMMTWCGSTFTLLKRRIKSERCL